jgi:hypothetical protein
VTGFPGLGLLRGLRPAPRSPVGDRPAPGADRLPAPGATGDGSHVHHMTARSGRCPALSRRHRHGYAADLHRGLRTGDITRSRSSRHDADAVPVRAATQPISVRLELVALLRGFQPLVPHVRLSVSLAEPEPSDSADPPRRCQGLLPTLTGVSRIRLPPATTRPLRRPGGEGLPPPLGSRAPCGARCPIARRCSRLGR